VTEISLLDSAMHDLFVKMQNLADHCLYQLQPPERSTIRISGRTWA